VHDPLANAAEALSEYGIALCEREDLRGCQAVILAVPHAQYLQMSVAEYGEMMDEGATLIDLKSVLDREELEAAKLKVWRL
jgi:UDP-N-acetyl-D-glucosamine/UDP-N-acetyl-D-galactosamine dehydrogenase